MSWLPSYIDELHRPLGEVPPDFRNDVVFVGHYEPDGRVETLNDLPRQGVPVRIYGNLWETAALDPALRQSPIRVAYDEDFTSGCFAGAKLALVFLAERNSGRLYEALFRDPGLPRGNP